MVEYRMSLRIREITAKSILSKSGIPGVDYCINPYVGCSHACVYCYATFMKRFTGHTGRWGTFVDAKVNAPGVLERQLRKAKTGSVMLSSVTDAYQPLEVKYRLTRQCLEVLLPSDFSVDILTKSPLVLRDVDLIRRFRDIEVGITITTDDERIRKIFEPHAPPIGARIAALKRLHEEGIRTYAFVGPVLPMDPEVFAAMILPYADSVLIDRMNYVSKTVALYRRLALDQWLDDAFLRDILARLEKSFRGKELLVCSES